MTGAGGPVRGPAPARWPASSPLLLLAEAGQQAERVLEHLRRDEAGGQLLVDLQAGQHRLPDSPGLDGRDPGGPLIAIGLAIGPGQSRSRPSSRPL
jgi:hypothetical protein